MGLTLLVAYSKNVHLNPSPIVLPNGALILFEWVVCPVKKTSSHLPWYLGWSYNTILCNKMKAVASEHSGSF